MDRLFKYNSIETTPILRRGSSEEGTSDSVVPCSSDNLGEDAMLPGLKIPPHPQKTKDERVNELMEVVEIEKLATAKEISTLSELFGHDEDRLRLYLCQREVDYQDIRSILERERSPSISVSEDELKPHTYRPKVIRRKKKKSE